MSTTNIKTEVEVEMPGETFDGIAAEAYAYSPLSVYEIFKGIIDRFLALVAIVLLSPAMVLIAICIKLDSKGSVIYRREQVGKNGRNFIAYKFRTMQTNNDDSEYKAYLVKYIKENQPYKLDENGQAIYKVVNDPRVTRVGSLLRHSNLDELPQVFNVLKGEMSFVGPRPDIPFSVNMYEDWQYKRLTVTPGITGLWQVSGRKELSFEEMIRMDIEYIEERSLLLDAQIALRTIGVIFKGDGS
jgi:lipopolysaccharide/colanic/teichoic acid biosynthesis glycosyltransferase